MAVDVRPEVLVHRPRREVAAFMVDPATISSGNNAFGTISKEQLAEDYPVWHTSLHNPDLAACARLCGATGIRRDQLDEAHDRALH